VARPVAQVRINVREPACLCRRIPLGISEFFCHNPRTPYFWEAVRKAESSFGEAPRNSFALRYVAIRLVDKPLLSYA